VTVPKYDGRNCFLPQRSEMFMACGESIHLSS
jgi:hypothetical protein